MTAPRMDPATGLLPGQSWAIPADGPWQARLDRAGRAHCIGRALAEHDEYEEGYADYRPGLEGFVFLVLRDVNDRSGWGRRWIRRPWHTFARACRAASYHERMTIAAKRKAAQAGQGGE